jgi:hypothetical protein
VTIRLGPRDYEHVEEVVADLERLGFTRTGPPPRRLAGLEFTTTLRSGCGARLVFELGRPPTLDVILSVSAPGAPPFEIVRRNLGARLSYLLRLQQPRMIDPHFDARYHVKGSMKGLRGRSATYAKRNASLVRSLFERYDVVKLAAADGELSAWARLGDLDPREDYGHVLTVLERIARDSLARRRIRVRVLGGREMSALVDRGRARCAYCHDEVSGRDAGLVACNLCSTVLHEVCWTELGHCPVLGCEGVLLEDVERAPLLPRRRRR